MWSIVTAGVAGTFNPNATTPGATFTHTSGGIGTDHNSALDRVQSAVYGRYCGCCDHNQVSTNGNSRRTADYMRDGYDRGPWRQHSSRG